MRQALALMLVLAPALASTSVWAAPAGPPVDRFAQTWSATPTDRFVPRDRPLPTNVVAVHAAGVPDGVLADALASAAEPTFRRDLAIDEMTSEWSSVQRIALEELRDAQRRYAAVAGGDADARGARFAGLLRQVVDGSGRSVAQDGHDADAALGATYDRVIRDAPDESLPKLEASEKAWTAYRDAFDRFAQAMDRPDAARSVRDDLARRRADELQAVTAK